MPKISAKFQRDHPQRGCQNRGAVGYNRRFSTNTSLYLRNGARYGHSYYGTLIGSYVLYRMVLFSVTLNDPNCPKPFHCFVVATADQWRRQDFVSGGAQKLLGVYTRDCRHIIRRQILYIGQSRPTLRKK